MATALGSIDPDDPPARIVVALTAVRLSLAWEIFHQVSVSPKRVDGGRALGP